MSPGAGPASQDLCGRRRVRMRKRHTRVGMSWDASCAQILKAKRREDEARIFPDVEKCASRESRSVSTPGNSRPARRLPSGTQPTIRCTFSAKTLCLSPTSREYLCLAQSMPFSPRCACKVARQIQIQPRLCLAVGSQCSGSALAVCLHLMSELQIICG